MTNFSTTGSESERTIQLTAKQETLAAIRTLVDYMRDDERDDYQERLEQGEGDGHIYESIAQIEQWLTSQPQVLHMVAGSDVSCGIPEARCESSRPKKSPNACRCS